MAAPTDAHGADLPEARTAIEKVLWRNGIVGDPSARVGQEILDALRAAGLTVIVASRS